MVVVVVVAAVVVVVVVVAVIAIWGTLTGYAGGCMSVLP